MKRLILAVTAALLVVSCGKKQQIEISGTLQNGANKVIYIEELSPDGPIFLDSIQLDDKGFFSFRYEMPYKTFYNLHVSQFDYVVLLPDYGEKIQLSGVYDSLMMTYRLKGGGDSQLLWQLQEYTNDGIRTLRRIGAIDQHNKQLLSEGNITEKEFEKAHAATDSIYLNTYYEEQTYVCRFIDDHAGSLATIIALYKPFNTNHPLIDPQQHFEYYDIVLQGLEESLPDNPHTLNFKNTVEHLRFQYAGQQ